MLSHSLVGGIFAILCAEIGLNGSDLCILSAYIFSMKYVQKILASVMLFVLFDRGLGQQEIFMENYREAIQKYIMTGAGEGWHHCDILSDNPSHNSLPQMTMDLDTVETLDVKSAFKYSHCLLIHYEVRSMETLSNLLEFCQEAKDIIRLALLVKLRPALTPEIAASLSNVSFFVAVESENGHVSFLCPIVGRIKPIFQHEMCNQSYLDHKNKVLRIGLLGIPPEFIVGRSGFDGTTIKLMDMMAEKLDFVPKVKLAPSFDGAINQVCCLLNNQY